MWPRLRAAWDLDHREHVQIVQPPRPANPIHATIADRFHLPADLLIRSHQTFAKHRPNPNSMLEDSKVLYDRHAARNRPPHLLPRRPPFMVSQPTPPVRGEPVLSLPKGRPAVFGGPSRTTTPFVPQPPAHRPPCMFQGPGNIQRLEPAPDVIRG